MRRFDPDCLLVFLTTSTDHALDGFRVRAFHYLVKPYTDGELTALFDEIIRRFPTPDKYIEVKTVGGTVRLRFREILYAEHYQHQIHIYSPNGQKTVTRQTFREFTADLTDKRFFLCSRGMIVNLEYAADFDGTDFILTNGVRIPVSRDLVKTARLAALMIPLLVFLSLAGGAVSCLFTVRAVWVFIPAASIAGTVYVRMLTISHWKSISVFLAICGSFSCMGGVAIAINDIVCPGNPAPPLSLRTAIIWFLMCCVSVVAAWYPATHAARQLLEEDAFAQTWYVFWILPVLFIGLNLILIPVYPGILRQGRLRALYILVSFSLLFLLLLFYALFYLMASALNRNDRLRQENQFLSMQQARYDSLRTAIAQTRQARHDMRHHFTVLQNLAAQKEWETLTRYLSDTKDNLPTAELNLCDNKAANSVASHYGLLYQKHGIPFTFALDLPTLLPVPEIDLCLVMSNLLENALEASQITAPAKCRISMRAYLHSRHMVLLTVENTFDGEIREKDGIFQSSKRRGDGVGLQSVRHIAEKNNGYCRFLYEGGVFRADVMLRGFYQQSHTSC